MTKTLRIMAILSLSFLNGCLDNGTDPVSSSSSGTVFVVGKVYVGLCSNIEWDSCVADSLIRMTLQFHNDPYPDSVQVVVCDSTASSASWRIDLDDGLKYYAEFAGRWDVPANMSLTTGQGNGSVSVSFPGQTEVTSHDHQDTVSFEQDLVVEWSGNSDWYSIRIYMSGSSIDTVVESRQLMIPASTLNNASAYLSIRLDGYNGPCAKNGESGNIEGDMTGYVVATNYSNSPWKRYLTLYNRTFFQ